MVGHQTQQCRVTCAVRCAQGRPGGTTITECLVAEHLPAAITTPCLELLSCQQQQSLVLLRYLSTALMDAPLCPPLPAGPELTPEEAELEEQVRQDAAVEMVAEMQLTAEQLKVGAPACRCCLPAAVDTITHPLPLPRPILLLC